MKTYVKIKADTNDADYIQSFVEIADQEVLDVVKKLAFEISNFKPYKSISRSGPNRSWTHNYNFPTGECLREDLGEKSIYELYPNITEDEWSIILDSGMIPYSEYGIHTVVSIELIKVSDIKKLF